MNNTANSADIMNEHFYGSVADTNSEHCSNEDSTQLSLQEHAMKEMRNRFYKVLEETVDLEKKLYYANGKVQNLLSVTKPSLDRVEQIMESHDEVIEENISLKQENEILQRKLADKDQRCAVHCEERERYREELENAKRLEKQNAELQSELIKKLSKAEGELEECRMTCTEPCVELERCREELQNRHAFDLTVTGELESEVKALRENLSSADGQLEMHRNKNLANTRESDNVEGFTDLGRVFMDIHQ